VLLTSVACQSAPGDAEGTAATATVGSTVTTEAAATTGVTSLDPPTTGAASSSASTGAQACDAPEILAAYCVGCHGEQAKGGLDLRPDGFAERLVGAPSQVPGCEGGLLIDPRSPADSQLLRVLSPVPEGSSCIVAMPPGGSLPPADVACISEWLETFADDAPGEPFEAAPIESVLVKVKLLITGTAPTSAELAAVKKDPAALRTLLTEWVETEAFARKLKDLLRLLLQQSPRPTDWAQVDGSNHAGIPRELAAVFEESAVRTAADIVLADEPLTTIFTTRRWSVTTAQLVVMRYADQTPEEKAQIHHKVVLPPDPPPASLEESIAKGLWYVDGIPTEDDPNTPDVEPGCRDVAGPELEVPEVLRFLWGHLRCRKRQDFKFAGIAPMSPSGPDFKDFRYVTFVQADAGETPAEPPFWDLIAWRDPGKIEVASRLPRAGFMTTPAFFNNWETNADNQFRVTANQTMIVALHSSFRVGEPTMPLHTMGVDPEHAGPGTDCYGCHRQMDPMRSWFQNAFSPAYQAGPLLTAHEPGFAFGGATFTGGDFDDFAHFLAEHPLVAAAWTQKLCWMANGAACSAFDEEFLRVAKVFQDSGFKLKTLIVELLSSPLVTGLAPTATWRGRDIPISLVRRQHLCAALDGRIVQGKCGDKQVEDPLALVPAEGFSRATVVPDVPRDTTVFSLAALEQLCTVLSNELVGKVYDETDPDGVIPQIVDELLGVPPGQPPEVGHSRHDGLVNAMKAHYAEVLAAPADYTELDAMKSALILGCVSPDAAAMGL
jgi:hypothetical protein